jgi:hypothetical protein
MKDFNRLLKHSNDKKVVKILYQTTNYNSPHWY